MKLGAMQHMGQRARAYLVRPASNVTASHQRVDVALSLCLVEAVLGHDLGHDIILVLERGQILLRELVPLRTDLFEDDLPRLGGSPRFYCRRRSHVGHEISPKLAGIII